MAHTIYNYMYFKNTQIATVTHKIQHSTAKNELSEIVNSFCSETAITFAPLNQNFARNMF